MSNDPLLFEVTKKRLMALALHGLRHGTVTLFVQAAHPGVVLPAGLNLNSEGCVRLDYDLHFVNPPIRDLRIDQVGVLGTLSFSQVPFETFVPWTAVRNMFWTNDLPVLTLAELDQIAAEHIAGLPPLVAAKPEPPRRLRRITQLDAFTPEEQADDPEKISQAFAAHGLRAV